MTKAELVDQGAATLALPKQQAETVVNLFWQCIMDAVGAGDKVELRGFGSFRLRHRRDCGETGPLVETKESPPCAGERPSCFLPSLTTPRGRLHMASVRVSAVPDRVAETGRHFPEKEAWQGTFLHK
jgi:integration host factor subunit beta